MGVVFYLSGEHHALPKNEVYSLLQYYGVQFKTLFDSEQIIVLRLKKNVIEAFQDLAMTHTVLAHLGICSPDLDGIEKIIERLGRVDDSFSVRVQRIKDSSKEVSTLALEKNIGQMINGDRVDLKNPKIRIQGFLTENKLVIGREILQTDRRGIQKRNPKYRPFFHPTSLSPILSKTVCNICGVNDGKKVLDPFCGTGGLLIEAGLLGATVHGMDIQKEMVGGTKENLEHYGIKGMIEMGDATKMDYNNYFDVVLTDLPYGRASTTKGKQLEDLYSDALNSIYRVLKNNGGACIISPENVPVEKMAKTSGFNILKIHLLRVHRSLTRKILILEKN